MGCWRWFARALTTSLVCSGCGGGPTAPAPATLEMDTWWTAPSELAAIQAVVSIHERLRPNVTVNVVSASSQWAMDMLIMGRFTAANPPAAFQANLGSNALQFAPSALALGTPDWAPAFNPTVLATLTQQGKLIGVPLGLTRQNVAYWNLGAISGLASPLNAIPKGIDAFKSWITGVAMAGYTHPLCFGFHDAWVNSHILFEEIVPAVLGPAYSRTYWSGQDTAGSAGMSPALDFAATYVIPYLTSDTPTMGMVAGIDRVMQPMTDLSQQCLMTAMGDWAGQQLVSAPDNYAPGPGKDFDAAGWPGADDLAVFDGDAMVAAAEAGHQAEVLALFETLASEKGQVAFVSKKGEVPARNLTATDLAQLPYLILVDQTALANASVPAFKVLANQNYPFAQLDMAVQNFFLTGDKNSLLTFLTQNYASLKP